MTETLTPRQQREREFYNKFSQHDKCDKRVILDPITSSEHRPWNPYWHFFRLVKDHFRPGMRLLDFGCGWGSNTILFAKVGYEIEGFDISEGNLEVARRLAQEHEVAERVHFGLQAAEKLSYPDEHFDVIAGIDILHHVQIEPAMAEVRRVLKPGGVAFFREPVENAIFDRLRNTWLVRKLIPNKVSLDRHITEDERKLNRHELRVICRTFPRHRIDRFRVMSRLAALFPKREILLEKLDRQMRWVPGYMLFCGTIVLTLQK